MQVQKLQNAQNQIQREIQYFIFQDLENALCQLGQLEETIEKLEKVKDHPYLPIAMNKAILQANLSFGIYFDQYSQHNNKEGQFFKSCKSKAKSIFQEALNKKIIQNTHPEVKTICNFYINELFGDKDIYALQQLPLKQTQSKGQFNQNALEKVIWGTQAVDKQLSQVQNNEYKPPDAQKIFQNVNIQKKQCGEQLIKNFLKPSNNSSTSKNQDQKPNNQSNKKDKQQPTNVKKVCVGKQTMEEEFEKKDDQFNMQTQNQQNQLKQNQQAMQLEKKKQPISHENSAHKTIQNGNQIIQTKNTQQIDKSTKGTQNNKSQVQQQTNKTQGVNQSGQIKKK
ncbi:unnamed protein product (macronuclear) [Paramecium tetraurelia]|uniref:Chromosome undetermined scaffold_1, whole genome shotgun sequence n=1 Tax=Paramecium tetraurelia TaxID=5888 RepID=Q6BG18_PARTE|nr:hypothetical protein [Paramecium tetraurelia strain d4-2]XP_001423278.1 uncharacterized protein GSPATT00000315001 [Paramecium tetraurelia]CAH03402.1 hypothetical protein PTMB.205 [Paramecium tetraurelia]CAK55880.1 unnamed protein product [Paramecium tetraurelia]|eukprot:XP_001423278.1 hypothetical protein (macronuclear) [Paramecium tetraurelia strain d4-2]